MCEDKKIKAAIFDCDGVLLDTSKQWEYIDSFLLRKAGLEYTEEFSRQVSHFSTWQAAEFFHGELGLGGSAQEVLGMIDDIMLNYYKYEAEQIAGSLDFVRQLFEKGVPCAVASTSPQQFLQPALKRCGFAPYLNAVVSVDDVQRPKTYPDVYNFACEILKATPDSTIVFEDSRFTFSALKQGGYIICEFGDVCGMPHGNDEIIVPDYSFSKFSEIDVASLLSLN